MNPDLNPLIGEQEVKANKLHFTHRIFGTRGVETKVVAWDLQNLRQFDDIDALIDSLPGCSGRPIQELRMDIAADCLAGKGGDYEDFAVVAYSGKSPMDRPIVRAAINGEPKFFMHPDIERMVKRHE